MFIDRCLDHITGQLQLSLFELRKIIPDNIDIEEILLGNTVFVELSNVSKWLYDGEKDIWSWWEDDSFPCLSPPWLFTWYEYIIPTVKIGGKALEVFSRSVKRVGVFTIGLSRKDQESEVQIAAEEAIRVYQEAGSSINIESSSINWAVIYFVFLEGPRFNNGYIFVGSLNSYLDKEGQRLFMTSRISDTIRGAGDVEAYFSSGGGLFTFSLPSLFGISLLHCKNIEVVERENNKEINIHRKRKGKKPLMEFKTLMIDSARKILKYEGKSNKVGLKKALHICRGHFRDYTEGRGLFGRYKGLYWVPMHTRGDEKVGIIEKDYKIGKMKK